jgi:hypothetical protein
MVSNIFWNREISETLWYIKTLLAHSDLECININADYKKQIKIKEKQNFYRNDNIQNQDTG